METEAIEALQAQLLNDMERFGDLMNRCALGETAVKDERDQLEGAVEVKLAILEGLKRLTDEMLLAEEELMLVGEDFFEDDFEEIEEDVEEDEEW